MKVINVLVLMLVAFLLIACSDSSDNITAGKNDTSNINEKVSAMVNGTITKIEQDSEYARDDYTEVYVRTEQGSEIKITFRGNDLFLHEISGKEASFEYEVTPGQGLINYSSAKEIAKENVAGDITEWKLSEDVSDLSWQYRFIFIDNSEESEIRLNAETGGVIEIKN